MHRHMCFGNKHDVRLLEQRPFLSVAHGHSPPHCENTQVLWEAITEDDDDVRLYAS